MRPSASLSTRVLAVAAATFLTVATVMPQDADARAGRSGSFGSRGSRTYDAPPPTATMPGAAPMQRSTTQPGAGGMNAQSPAAAAQQGRSGGLFGGRMGGLGAGLMGGLLGAGIFGLLAGNGFFGGLGSLTSILGLVIQLAIVFFVVRFLIGWFRNRQQGGAQPAAAAAGGYGYDPNRGSNDAAPQGGLARMGYDDRNQGGDRYGYGGGSGYGSGSGSSRDGQGDVEIAQGDYEAFERLLTEVQDAWSNQDLSRLRGLVTPEMIEIFSDDLAEDASNGVVNKVSGVKLLQGDLAESWSEGAREYATVAMRYELVDVTEERDTGRVVDGDTQPTEATEMWTFLRAGRQGRWLLSAIQQAA